MKLFDYFRSSAAYRVRIALNLKGLTAERQFVHLTRNGGEQRLPGFRRLNPQGLVPALDTGNGAVLTQSLAILEYLDETCPEPYPLLPARPVDRARVRAVSLAVACDIHPLNNLRVLKYLKGPLGHDQDQVTAWYRHWIGEGFCAIEQLIGDDGYCHGGQVSLADVCLIPQIFNARRFDVDLGPWPRIARVEQVAGTLPAFADAHPALQPDAE